MSRRYRGAILSPSSTTSSLPVSGIWTGDQQSAARGAGLWPASPSAPTIGTVTAGNNLCAIVPFTPPTCFGAPLPISFVATSTPGCFTGTSSTTPIVVAGLTPCVSYTFKVKAVTPGGGTSPESAASNSMTPLLGGQTAYTAAGTYSFVVPAGVTSVSAVTIGGGGGGGWPCGAGGGGGGATAYANNISVAVGQTVSITVAAGGSAATSLYSAGYAGGYSQVVYAGTTRARANGGSGGFVSPVSGGTVATGTGGAGGTGGGGREPGGGGGGAGGYSGTGGTGGNSYGPICGTAGAGGGGNGGNAGTYYQCCWGAGCGGFIVRFWNNGANGGGQSVLGLNGACKLYGYGGGGGGASETYYSAYERHTGAAGGGGAVRLIYPGTTRSFPSTNTGNI